MRNNDPAPQIPETIPVMVLSDCQIFPHGILPLFIFEERYREMLEHALENDRIFCIGSRRPGTDPEADDVFPETTAGMIRACAKHEDGTSHLVLQGLQRIRIRSWIQEGPFRIAKVDPLPSKVLNQQNAQDLAARLRELTSSVLESDVEISDNLRDQLSNMQDPETAADIAASTFVSDPAIRQELISMSEVESRLELVIQQLEKTVEQFKL